MKYRVGFYQDNEYEVLKKTDVHVLEDGYSIDYSEWDDYERQVFKGSISDCEAYIRLHEQGYM